MANPSRIDISTLTAFDVPLILRENAIRLFGLTA